MTAIATVLAVIVIMLLSLVVLLSFAIYLKLIEKITDGKEDPTADVLEAQQF